MKLVKLVIKNFFSIEEASLCLADRGLVSVEGVNEDGRGADSNGSGKSSLINAVLWCNYGEAGKKVKSDGVVNKKKKKDCEVVCVWEDEANSWRISRYRKHSTHKNAIIVEIKDGENWKDITKAGASAVQEQINEILGQDLLTFKASCFAQQKEDLDIPALTDKGLKELLEKVLPFEDLTEQHEKAKKNVAELSEEIDKHKEVISSATTVMAFTKKKAQDAIELIKDFESKKVRKAEEINKLIKLKVSDIGKAAASTVNLEALDKREKRLKDELESLGDTGFAPTSFIKQEIEQIKKEMEHPPVNCPTCGQVTSSLEEVMKHLEERMEKARKRFEEATEYNAKMETQIFKKKELGRMLQSVLETRRRHERAVDEIRLLRAELKALEAKKVESAENPYRKLLDGLKSDFQEAKETKKEFEQQVEEALEHLEILKAVEHTFSPKGVRYHMLETVAPKLTEATNKYLKILTDDTISVKWSTVTKTGKGEYKEKFKIDCYDKGAEIEYGSLSGGESRKVKLACFFGLQDIIAAKATKNIELWCGDEIDHALDAAGIERLMSVLVEKAESKGSILVVSHNNLRDWIPNLAIVHRKDGISKVSGYLNER